MKDIPTSLDELVRDSRQRIDLMRRQLGDPQDFDFLIRQQLEAFIADYPLEVRRFTMRAIFGS